MRFARHAVAFAAALNLALPAALAAQDEAYVPPPEELALARGIIEVMYPVDKREELLLAMAGNIAKQYSDGVMDGPLYAEPDIRAIMDKFMAEIPEALRPAFAKHMPIIFEATAVAYTRQYTLAELRDILAFAKTPSGQRYFSTLTELLGDPAVARANQAYFAELAPASRAYGEKANAALREYLMANPDVLERLRKSGLGKDK
jgi:hypothetical protein